jgi:hypothetical protein
MRARFAPVDYHQILYDRGVELYREQLRRLIGSPEQVPRWGEYAQAHRVAGGHPRAPFTPD